MKTKQIIYKIIEQLTRNVDYSKNPYPFTASAIGEKLAIKRNAASQYLNELVKEKILVKISTRPVIFLSRKVLENCYKVSIGTNFSSVNQLEQTLTEKTDYTPFNDVIGNDGSLRTQIEQLKAAAYYPGSGLPILLSGPTGVGKSYLASIYYKFCFQQGLVGIHSKFVHLNCAEYADNPELLSSILFGYIKGAFTGADQDTSGLFDKASNGVLFLDEVHRLDAKGQEKLFGYLDRGIINPVGATSKEKHINVHLVLATTEDIQSTFLQTFIRRIPIHIKIPSLLGRPKGELEELILNFFRSEAIKLNKQLEVTAQVRHALLCANYENNVGDLKNFVTLSVARALINQQRTKQHIVIDLSCLPVELRVQEIDRTKVSLTNEPVIVVNKDTELSTISTHNNVQKKIDEVVNDIAFLCTNGDATRQQVFAKVNVLIDALSSDDMISMQTDQYLFLSKSIGMALETLKEQFHIDFLSNLSIEIAKYLYLRGFYKLNFQSGFGVNSTNITNLDQLGKKMMDAFIKIMRNTFNIELQSIDYLVIGIYLSSAVLVNGISALRCVIIAHGRSTASSMADVVNRLVGRSIVDALDMPFDLKPSEIGHELSNFIEDHRFLQGLILLVDMGSLVEIQKQIAVIVDFPIGLVTNTSTEIALSVAEKINKKQNIEQILSSIEANAKVKTSIKYPVQSKRDIILTCCATGQGTAVRVKELLQDSFPRGIKISILPYDAHQLENSSIREMIQTSYNCLAVVGTIDPQLEKVPFISLELLISGKNFNVLTSIFPSNDEKMIKEFNTNIVRNFTVERVLSVLTILDAKAILKAVDIFIKKYEHLTKIDIDNQTRIALYVHISGLVERLIRNESIDSKVDLVELDKKYHYEFKQIKIAFSVIEDMYSVKIPMTEISYLHELIMKTLA